MRHLSQTCNIAPYKLRPSQINLKSRSPDLRVQKAVLKHLMLLSTAVQPRVQMQSVCGSLTAENK
jgi:hypothetical protein